MTIHRPFLALLLFCLVLGFWLGTPDQPYAEAWWSVVYPEFFSNDIHLVSESEKTASSEQKLEIRWRSQEIYRQWQAEFRDVSPAASADGCFPLP